MANIKAGKSSNSNLKVPPLKIVLSSHQNNSAIVNVSNHDGDESDSRRDKMDRDYQVESDGDTGDKRVISRKNSRSSPDRKDADHLQTPAKNDTSSSSSTSSSDRSTTTSPSSESESLDSNLTIISDNQQTRTKVDQREEAPQTKQEKTPRHTVKGEKSTSGQQSNKRANSDNLTETVNDSNNQAGNRDQSLNANQRITRSSQRAAQQNKSENPNDVNNDDLNVPEYPDKTVESARKIKRRKGEQQESETDGGQQIAQQPLIMANICPADYQPPSQNSFELYRDIRKRPYKKMLKLNNFQAKTPQGFKDYLLNSGPYLLDGNRLGVGLSGPHPNNSNYNPTSNGINHRLSSSRLPLRMKLSNLHSKLSSNQASHQRHNAYVIPKLVEVPKSLTVGSPLHELFQDQEKARYQMRMQHLKERERSVMAAEQEILRAYNRVTMADNRQEFNLSACTYFYYQERYHYLDEATGSKKGEKPKEIPHSQDNSNLCIDAPKKSSEDSDKTAANVEPPSKGGDANAVKIEKDDNTNSGNSDAIGQQNKKDKLASESANHNDDDQVPSNNAKNGRKESSGSKQDDKDVPVQDAAKKEKSPSGIQAARAGESESNHSEEKSDHQSKPVKSDGSGTEIVNGDEPAIVEISDEDLKISNRSALIDQLQEVDDKWADIKKQMFIRHKNESDSLYAVQSMEWEWKAKEIGACDVRITLKIENEFVPRVEVSALDY